MVLLKNNKPVQKLAILSILRGKKRVRFDDFDGIRTTFLSGLKFSLIDGHPFEVERAGTQGLSLIGGLQITIGKGPSMEV